MKHKLQAFSIADAIHEGRRPQVHSQILQDEPQGREPISSEGHLAMTLRYYGFGITIAPHTLQV